MAHISPFLHFSIFTYKLLSIAGLIVDRRAGLSSLPFSFQEIFSNCSNERLTRTQSVAVVSLFLFGRKSISA